MIAIVHEVILEDCRQTIHDVCDHGPSYGSRQHILADELNIRQIAAKMVLLLNNDQRDHRFLGAPSCKKQLDTILT